MIDRVLDTTDTFLDKYLSMISLLPIDYGIVTAQKMKFFIKDFFSKCDQICRELRIWSHLLKKSSMENFIFCAGYDNFNPVKKKFYTK